MTATTITTSTERPARLRSSPRLVDGAFLAAIVVLSAIPYLGGLGFYSDDWAFLAVLSTAEDQSLPGLVRDQVQENPGALIMRPTQIVYQAALYGLFGLEPLGYHLVNIAVLAAAAIVLSLVLRELRLPRVLAVAVPAVYALLPTHSTNRFWFASFGYLLSVALYLVGLYGDLRAAASERPGLAWRWKALALGALGLAAFGYEVVLPLFLLNVVLAEVVARRVRPGGLRASLGTAGRGVFHGATLAVAVGAVAYKASVAIGLGIQASPVRYALRLAAGAVGINFGTYGVALPHTAAWSFPRAGITGVAVAAAIALAMYRYLAMARGHDERQALWGSGWGRLAGAGIVVFTLGYTIFLTTGRIGFSSVGIANRVGAAAALGSSIVLVSALGWVASRLPGPTVRDRAFRGGVATLCFAGVVVASGVASFWVESWRAQRDVLEDVHTTFPTLPSGSTVLLAGVCPYIGPAIVFESSWDLRGALRLHHRDRSLEADVTTRISSIEPRGVITRIYQVETTHPYGERLFLYDRRGNTSAVLDDEADARRLLSEDMSDAGCPEGQPGAGTVTLPFDVAIGWFHSRVSG